MDELTRKAIDAAGGITSFAKSLRIKPPSVYGWTRVPAERVLDVERVSGISRHELRPDLYPRDAA